MIYNKEITMPGSMKSYGTMNKKTNKKKPLKKSANIVGKKIKKNKKRTTGSMYG